MTNVFTTFLRVASEAGVRQALRSALAETRMSVAAQKVTFTLASAIGVGVFLGALALIASLFFPVEMRLVALFFVVGFLVSLLRGITARHP